jgi:hypothetical protein
MASSREELERQLFDESLMLTEEKKKKIAVELLRQLDAKERQKILSRFEPYFLNDLIKDAEFIALSKESKPVNSTNSTPSPPSENSSGVSDQERLAAMQKKFDAHKRPPDPTPPQPSQKPSVHFSGEGSPSLQDFSTKMEKKSPGFKGSIKQDEQTKEEALDYSFTDRDCQYNGTLTGQGKGKLQVINTGNWTHRDVDEFVAHLCNDLGAKKVHIEQETVHPLSMMIKACEILESRGVSLTIYKDGAPEGTPPKTIDDLKGELNSLKRKGGEIDDVDMPLRYQEFLKETRELESKLLDKKFVYKDIKRLSRGDESDRQRAMELNQGTLEASAALLEIQQKKLKILKECASNGEFDPSHPHIINEEKSIRQSVRTHESLIRRVEKKKQKLEAGEPIGREREEPERTPLPEKRK